MWLQISPRAGSAPDRFGAGTGTFVPARLLFLQAFSCTVDTTGNMRVAAPKAPGVSEVHSVAGSLTPGAACSLFQALHLFRMCGVE